MIIFLRGGSLQSIQLQYQLISKRKRKSKHLIVRAYGITGEFLSEERYQESKTSGNTAG